MSRNLCTNYRISTDDTGLDHNFIHWEKSTAIITDDDHSKTLVWRIKKIGVKFTGLDGEIYWVGVEESINFLRRDAFRHFLPYSSITIYFYREIWWPNFVIGILTLLWRILERCYSDESIRIEWRRKRLDSEVCHWIRIFNCSMNFHVFNEPQMT